MRSSLYLILLLSLLHLCLIGVSAQSYTSASSSVLSSGKWVKASVSESGLYRLTAKTLSSWGYNDISKIAVYSNGGAELPLLNSTSRIDDLALLPVYRTNNEVVFYISARDSWKYNYSSNIYECKRNEWDGSTYVFITDDTTPSPSLESCPLPSSQPSHTVTYNSTLNYHELHKVNIHQSGQSWYGEPLNKQNPKLNIDFGSLQRASSGKVYVRLQLCAATKERMEYSLLYNDSTIVNNYIRAYQSANEVAVGASTSRSFAYKSSNAANVLSLQCSFSQATDIAYLDNVTLEVPTKIQMPKNGILSLNISQGTREARYLASKVSIDGANKDTWVWCVDDPTNPTSVVTSTEGSTMSFSQSNSQVHKYIAFNASAISSLPEPIFDSAIANQNLHATPSVEYLIVYHPLFKAQAEELADFHRQHSGLSVAAINVNEIYNEFGGGQRSAIAIRDFVKYLYTSYDGALKYLLLFGSGSYDNLSYDAANPFNLIPTYQSAQSLNLSQTYCTDDFYGWLDKNEVSSDTRATLEIGIGRFPVTNVADAQVLVDRVKRYMSNPDKGAWINRAIQFACEGDNNEHALYANENADYLESSDESMDVVRIFSEVYPNVQSTVGRDFPLAINDFYNNINCNGAFLVNYVGHGGQNGAGAYIANNKLSLFSNRNKLPFFFGATCDFAPFDRFETFVSRDLLTFPYGGFIGVLSTTRLVYGNNSHTLNMAFLQGLSSKNDDGGPIRVGDALKYAKRRASSMVNSLKYVLLGDPALVLVNNVNYSVTTDSICSEPYESCITPIKALTSNPIVGTIRDANGEVVENFNGEVEVSLYDKRVKRSSLGAVSPVFSYTEWGKRLFHSTCKVTNGQFNVPILLSKDIDVVEGYGRLSYVAWSTDGNYSAKGGSNMVLVGGLSDAVQTDTIGPDVKLTLDFPSWHEGMATSASPMLYAVLSDISGINFSGIGIGHSITLTIDDNFANSIVMDDYYSIISSDPETGRIVYQLDNLTPGIHKVSLKAWDNMGNSTTETVSILIASQAQIQFDGISLSKESHSVGSGTYTLHFYHNNASAANSIYLSIYSVDGKLMGSAQTTLPTGTTDSGSLTLSDLFSSSLSLPRGVYILNAQVEGSNGRMGDFTRKLVF
ncbi:MAG: type IX secretion system sortase PorU [Bacteroidia bacterium]|nr:type IX secretion system sortase PorU [Bacteroidia bacterium]